METLKFCSLPLEELKSVLKSRMNEHRYAHSLNVAERAVFLAKKYGADPEKAEFAGLIHDICKGIPNEEQLAIGDVNASGDIDSMDYVLIKRAYFGVCENKEKIDELIVDTGYSKEEISEA